MNEKILKKAFEAKKTKDDATIIAEHSAIIQLYKQTGYLNRDDAAKKYQEFNDNHPEYYLPMKAKAIQTGTALQINDPHIPDDVIIGNLKQQLCYLTEKSLLEEAEKLVKGNGPNG